MSIGKREHLERIQDMLGTKVGTLEYPEEIFLDDMFPLYEKVQFLGKVTETEELPIIQNALKRIRAYGLHKSLKQMNDRTQLTAFLTRNRKLRTKTHGVTKDGDDLLER